MKNWEMDSWESFNRESFGKKVIIYGAGTRCQYYLPIMDKIYDIPYIVDSDQHKWGTKIVNKEIYSPDILINLDKSTFVVLILIQKAAVIANMLEEMGIYNYYSEYWMDNTEWYVKRRKQLEFPEDKIQKIFNLLSDERSKTVFSGILEKRKMGSLDYSDLMEVEEGEYFRKEFFLPSAHDIYIDGGAFDGDSVEQYIRYNPNFKKIYVFEPDQINFEKFLNSFIYQAYKDKIIAYNYALYDKEATLDFYAERGVSSKLVESSTADDVITQVKGVSIDSIIHDKVTFLKLDVEGGEMKAIEGARQIIKRNKPNLAICIYHKLDDLWNILLLIHEIVPEYQFFIRHHRQLYFDTILYAHI